ncbi:MAG: alkaline phosphatase family protein [Tidjanibacter sp.]|nr:alkaline phosphatase family protein [Tidjanibacter sp.]
MLLASTAQVDAAESPRLVVNIVVDRMTGDELSRYCDNFSSNGLRLFMEQGYRCDEACYPFMVNRLSGCATLSTGTVPAVHGIVGARWWDYNSGQEFTVEGDSSSSSFNCDYDQYRVSNKNLTVATLGDRLLEYSPESRVVSIGSDAAATIVLGGQNSNDVWWLDNARARWTTSTKYRVELPVWVKKYNSGDYARNQLSEPWRLLYETERYHNGTQTEVLPPTSNVKAVGVKGDDIARRLVSPASNSIVADFVKEAVIYNRLGSDDKVDLLNVYFGAPREIEERYGRLSREKEDMYYRLDTALAELMRFVSAQCGGRVLFVLTSDGGSENVSRARQFNVQQSIFLVSSFLSATYGGDNWVLGYSDGNLFLNRMQIFSKGLDLAAVQRQIASFMLQFRGVAATCTASELTVSGGKGQLAERVANSFNPKRSGDIVVVLQSGWTERLADNDERQAAGGSLYDSNTVVPIIFYGSGINSGSLGQRVETASLAATLARIMRIPTPSAATAPAIGAVVEQFK